MILRYSTRQIESTQSSIENRGTHELYEYFSNRYFFNLLFYLWKKVLEKHFHNHHLISKLVKIKNMFHTIGHSEFSCCKSHGQDHVGILFMEYMIFTKGTSSTAHPLQPSSQCSGVWPITAFFNPLTYDLEGLHQLWIGMLHSTIGMLFMYQQLHWVIKSVIIFLTKFKE